MLAANSSQLCGVLLAALAIDRLGRVKTQLGAYAGAAASALLLGYARAAGDARGAAAAAAGFCAVGCAMAAASATWVHTPELLATRERASGHAVVNALAKAGAFASPYLVDSRLPLTAVGGSRARRARSRARAAPFAASGGGS